MALNPDKTVLKESSKEFKKMSSLIGEAESDADKTADKLHDLAGKAAEFKDELEVKAGGSDENDLFASGSAVFD